MHISELILSLSLSLSLSFCTLCRMYLEDISEVNSAISPANSVPSKLRSRGRNSTGDNEHLKSVAAWEKEREREREGGYGISEAQSFREESLARALVSLVNSCLQFICYKCSEYTERVKATWSSPVACECERFWGTLPFARLYLGIFVCSPRHNN